jgi:hypothetical protein
MRLTPNPARTTPHCKKKRVNPAFRSVSTPWSTKGLHAAGPVNPTAPCGSPSEPRLASEWSAVRLSNGCESNWLALPRCASSGLASAVVRRSNSSSIPRSGRSHDEP